MADNTFVKPSKIVDGAIGLLEAQLVLQNLLWRWPLELFKYAEDDTVNIRIPATTDAREYDFRSDTRTITVDTLAQSSIPVTLDKVVYNAIGLKHEEMTMDVTDFTGQVALPQVKALARKAEADAVTLVESPTYATTLTFDSTDPQATALDARAALNDYKVPTDERFAICGSAVARVMLGDAKFTNAQYVGTDVALAALKRAELRMAAGFDFYEVPGLAANECYFLHRSAFVSILGAPYLPPDAPMSAASSYNGLSLRWIRSYDVTVGKTTSLFDYIAGYKAVEDGTGTEAGKMVRAIKAEIV